MSVQIDWNKANAATTGARQAEHFLQSRFGCEEVRSHQEVAMFPRSARSVILGHPFDAEPCKMRCASPVA
jgi:hypothetical protein